MITRLLRLRREPASIFEHIDAHVRPGVPGLAEGGIALPDDELFSERELHSAPSSPEDDADAIERIHGALAALARRQNTANRLRLRAYFREGEVRGRIDGLRDLLTAEPPPDAVRLYPELREIFLGSGHRDEVRYAMALMSGFGRREDADPFRIVGRHDEFTLYAAVALATVTDDPLEEWLDLLPHVSGMGRAELTDLILREPRSASVRERLGLE